MFALLGHPVAHSISPAMHTAAFRELGIDAQYIALDVLPDNLEVAIAGARALGFSGANLTIPHKERALSFVEPDGLAAAIGAINTVDFRQMKGYNTDGMGFLQAMKANGVKPDGQRVLLIGAGGAARAIAYTLADNGAELTIVNRDRERAERLAGNIPTATVVSFEGLNEIARDFDVIVNATPVGMHPDTESTVLTRDALSSDQLVFDTIYNPQETKLLSEATAAGARTINGIKMLVWQGAESLRIWLDVEPPVDAMERAARKSLYDG